MKRMLAFLGVCLALCLAMIGCTSTMASPVTTSLPTTIAAASPPLAPTPPTNTPTPVLPAATEAPPTSVLPSQVMWNADGVIEADEYPHMIEVAGVEFHWAQDDENLYAAMAAETSGWVAVGFDPEVRMQGANYVVGYVKDGEVFVQDMFGVKPAGLGSHPPDEELGGSNDILEYAGLEEGKRTVIEFKIPLDSGDEYDKPLSLGASYDLIMAIGSGDDFDSPHVARGYGKMTVGE